MTQREKHMRVLEDFAARVRDSPGVLALLLTGSLSYGTVWEKSDIDLTLLVRDGTTAGEDMQYCVDGDGIEMHVWVAEMSRFKKQLRGSRAGLFFHSYISKGTVVFSKDDTLADFLDEARTLGTDDAMIAYVVTATILLVEMYRAEKWVTALHDELYAQRFLQKCCTYAADMVLLLAGEIPTRESVLRATELNPELMREVYVLPSTTVMTEADIRRALKALDAFMEEHMFAWSEPIVKFLADGDARRVSECAKHFGTEDISYPLAWLAARGVIERVSLPSRIFKHIRLTVDEIAYFHISDK